MNTKNLNYTNLDTKKDGIPFALFRAFVLLCLFAPSCFSLFSQDYKADLEKAYTLYSGNNYEIEIEHWFYPSYSATQPTEKENVWVYKGGDNYHLRQYGMEVIVNQKYILTLYEDDKFISIEEKNRQNTLTAKEQEGVELLVKSLTETAASLEKQNAAATADDDMTVKYAGISDGSKRYRFDFTKGEYTRMDVAISAKTGLMEKITCYYRAPFELEPGKYDRVKVDFVFKKQAVPHTADQNMFSIDHILSVNDRGEVALKEKYQYYTIINNIRR